MRNLGWTRGQPCEIAWFECLVQTKDSLLHGGWSLGAQQQRDRLTGGEATGEKVFGDYDAAAITRIRKLRARITGNFVSVNAQADAVPFEIGPLRSQHMAARDRIRRWQAALRTFFLLELALLQRRQFPGWCPVPHGSAPRR